MEKLKAEHGERWFSCHEFKATMMKHSDHVEFEKQAVDSLGNAADITCVFCDKVL